MFKKLFKPFGFHSKSEEEELGKIAAQEQKHFSYHTLSKATHDFHPSRKLGQGGFGPVYKGKLVDGREIAVKMLSKYSRQGVKEFTNEAKLLARVQHRNVVNLVGYCANGDDKLLVYEYVPHQSLDKVLFEPEKCHELDWKRRYDIICGIAKGLLYLHEDSHCRILHRDIKASNILLDDKWVPKIADFGLARLFPEEETHVNTKVAGTNGYMAPEYLMHGCLSEKADVFSFGVLVLELISGRKNSSYNLSPHAQNLLEWAYKLLKKGRSIEVLDPSITTTGVAEQVTLCVQIALLCTQSDPNLRPAIRRVVVLLSKKPSSLEEPTRPGIPGSRYRRSRRPGGSTSNMGTSDSTYTTTSRYTSSTTSGSATATASVTNSAATASGRSRESDPKGKRAVEFV